MHLIHSIIFHVLLLVTLKSHGYRVKRFLSAEVHNRIQVLEQSHSDHRGATEGLRSNFYQATIAFGIALTIIILIMLYFCRRIRRSSLSTRFPFGSSNINPTPTGLPLSVSGVDSLYPHLHLPSLLSSAATLAQSASRIPSLQPLKF